MVEFVLSWIMLLVGIAKGEVGWFIASGVYAVATQINLIYRRKYGGCN